VRTSGANSFIYRLQSGVNPTSTRPGYTQAQRRKADLVTIGMWAISAGRPWLIEAVGRVIQRERLQSV
jgi:hypothetical protein